ncbi:bifunctional pyr operon transcriptional regulator/uracil phosphoribosyltransferase PyrR [Sediminicurvatus halobius]|uniref:Bifunctional pyr operon transcriptional regulator/uracil phosphoribosyltransferase PyrR n=1 Tax=Sediminicurvatus halobius TaxID=2182432 RepID=A0A2U2MZ40_9GAMM|nr:bifunctional pyr operon transcriptional regulator/uracil phosphoribosyltransferase PyrR [Spiribacter halobius]PWG61984.1 bifunctional pyr operon transcriptional regulator/uracil phosphoribosyltransferase PyrR [Spiribacter halobius]UEX78390.1 bifunctional pyr operon transcriptional regulator/uracil phosphoribosyltransferase PyrR [Spiribacter halobius]
MSAKLPDVPPLLDRLAAGLEALLADEGRGRCTLVGIHSGGVWLAEALHQRLGLAGAPGALDIAFYRDDLARSGMQARVRPSRLPLTVDDRVVILVDDVLYTGRTVRAALNEVFDYGRPAAVRLAVLVDRPGRELPIAADVAATRLELPAGQRVKLQGPAPLRLVLEGGAP